MLKKFESLVDPDNGKEINDHAAHSSNFITGEVGPSHPCGVQMCSFRGAILWCERQHMALQPAVQIDAELHINKYMFNDWSVSKLGIFS